MAGKDRLFPIGVAMEVAGTLALATGAAGMLLVWPIPDWTMVAFPAGMVLTIPGAFLMIMGRVNRATHQVMAGLAHDPAPAGLARPPAPAGAGGHVSAADVIARGTPVMATVLGTFSTDGMTAGNGDPILGLHLRVPGPHGPYEVRLAHRVPPQYLALVFPDTRLPAVIAPEDPGKVAIDWDRVPATPEALSGL
ncbi:hypothetical protein [Nonomuraea sp. NPDC050783]|uniref:hypothetical protein n=1 Tax=Nonomuraea sp. NPDC050783 TaxID=3154634 RepID=UPI003465DEA6